LKDAPKSSTVRIQMNMSCPFHAAAPSYPSPTPVSLAQYPRESWLFGGASAVARNGLLNVGQFLPLHLPGRLKRRLERELGALNNFLGRLIDQRRNEPPRRDFLGLLLSGGGEHGPPVSRQAVLDESVTMLLADTLSLGKI